MKDIIQSQQTFSNEFIKSAGILDILFLIYCLVYPFFMKPIIVFVLIFSNIAVFYMFGVINLFSTKKVINNITNKSKTNINKD